MTATKKYAATGFALTLAVGAGLSPAAANNDHQALPPQTELKLGLGTTTAKPKQNTFPSASIKMAYASSAVYSFKGSSKDVSLNLDSYVERKLSDLVLAREKSMRVREISATIARQVIGGVADSEKTIYPSIAPNGTGGVVLYWKAKKQVVEVELDPDMSFYVRAIDANGRTILEKESRAGFPTEEIRKQLEQMSKDVAGVNPNWRAVFAR